MRLVAAHDLERQPIDTPLEAAHRSRKRHGIEKSSGKSRPLRLRVAPDLYFWGGEDPDDKPGYRSWHGLSWIMELDTVAETQAAREVLGLVIQLMTRYSPQSVLEELRQVAQGRG